MGLFEGVRNSTPFVISIIKFIIDNYLFKLFFFLLFSPHINCIFQFSLIHEHCSSMCSLPLNMLRIQWNVPSVGDSNLNYIISSYLKHWKQRLLVFQIKLCFLVFNHQFMQIINTPNIIFLNTT